MKRKLFLLLCIVLASVSLTKADVTVGSYVYFNDFETVSEKTATGTATGSENVNATIQGSGTFEDEGGYYGKVFQNVGGAMRTNYLLLPDDALAHASESQALTIGFWVSAGTLAADIYTYAPIFTAYASAPTGSNGSPMFVMQSRGPLQVNMANEKWCDFAGAQNVNGKITIYNTNSWEASDANYINGGNWLGDQKWHYLTIVMTPTNAKVYMDGTIKNEWNIDGTSTGQQNDIFASGTNLKYICLGGNQAWWWADNDGGFKFDDLFITNVALTKDEIDEIIADKTSYSYVVNAFNGSHKLLKQIASGTYTDTDITVAYPQYIQDGTTLYNIPQNGSGDYFRTTFTPDADNYEKELTYNGTTVSNVYLYIEGEDISDISQANSTARASNGKMGYTSNISTYVPVANLPVGTYQIYARPVRTNKDNATCKFKVGDEEKFSMTMQQGTYDIQNSEPFTIESAQTLSIACEGSSTSGLDWLYLKGTPKYKVIGATDCSTYYLTEASEKRTLVSGNSYHYSFINHNKAGNYNAWNSIFCVWNGNTEDQKLVIRLDRWEDKKGSSDGFAISENWDWDKFFSEMEGAKIDATVSYSGNIMTLRYDITTASDESWWMTYNSSDAGVELSGNIQVALSVSNSWLELIEEGPRVTLGTNGYTTFATPNALDLTKANLPSGLKAYKAQSVNSTYVHFEEFDQTVPANTGILFEGTASETYTVPVVANGDAVSENAFEVNTDGETFSPAANTKYYALIKNSSPMAFGWFEPNNIAIPANKAYIPVVNGSNARLIISFDDEDPTGINTVEASEAETGALKDGKYLIGNKIVLVKNGVKYSANGQKLN